METGDSISVPRSTVTAKVSLGVIFPRMLLHDEGVLGEFAMCTSCSKSMTAGLLG